MERLFLGASTAFMFLSILAGSFGAHGLKAYFQNEPYYKEVFEKAVFYQMIHALALLAIVVLLSRFNTSLVSKAGVFFILGIIIFSGSLYLLVLTKIRGFGAVTPFGGISFLVGWGFLFAASLKR